jgi:hemolysin activation/secretion protein
VRAHDVGAVSADAGALAPAEMRRDLGTARDGQWQALAFIDSAHVTLNKTAWVAGPNIATLNGAGMEPKWAGVKQWNAKLVVAAPIGSTPALMGKTNSARTMRPGRFSLVCDTLSGLRQ